MSLDLLLGFEHQEPSALIQALQGDYTIVVDSRYITEAGHFCPPHQLVAPGSSDPV